MHTGYFNILRRSGAGQKETTSENQRFSEVFYGLMDPLVIRVVSDILHSTELICSVLSFVSIFLTTNCTRHEFIGFP